MKYEEEVLARKLTATFTAVKKAKRTLYFHTSQMLLFTSLFGSGLLYFYGFKHWLTVYIVIITGTSYAATVGTMILARYRLHRIELSLNEVGLTSALKKVGAAPGHTIIRFAEFIFSRRFFNRVCVPAVSDMREEYFEALSQNRIWKARWVRIRGTYSFFAAIGLDRAFAFVSFFVKAWKSVN